MMDGCCWLLLLRSSQQCQQRQQQLRGAGCFTLRGHQRGSASAAAQAWLEKEISDFSPSKTNIREYLS
jgi:hypothetical protein